MKTLQTFLNPALTGCILLGLLSGCSSTDTKNTSAAKRKVKKKSISKTTPKDKDKKTTQTNKNPKPDKTKSTTASKDKPPLIQHKDAAAKKEAEEFYKETTLKGKTAQAVSEYYFKIGKRFYDQFQFEKAEENFRKAYEIYPKNLKAQRHLFLVQYILQKRSPHIKFTAQRLAEEKQVMIAERQAQMKRSFERAMEYKKNKEYKKAILLFEKVIEIIRSFPYKIDKENLAQKAQNYIKYCKRQYRRQQIEEREERQAIALKKAREEELKRIQARKRKIKKLLRKAHEFNQLHQYKKAIQILKELLNEDPGNPTAQALLKLAQRGALLKWRKQIYQERKEYLRQDFANTDKVTVPYSDFIRYPSKKEWEITLARSNSIQNTRFETPQWILNMKAVLRDKKIPTVSFKETPLPSVVEFLQDISGQNIIVDPQMEGAEEKLVTLELKNISLENILNILVKQLDLEYIFDKEALVIVEKGKVDKKVIFDIYNVQDLLNPIQDFPGPKLKLPDRPSNNAGGGGGAAPLPVDDEEEGDKKAITPEDLIDIIKKSTGEQNWEDQEKTLLQQHRGQLLVLNTPEVHMKVREILKELRKNSGLFVVIEARFITIINDYLRDIGVDYRGLGTGGLGMALNLDPNTSGGTDAGFQRKQDPNNPNPSENLAGRIQNIFDGFQGFFGGERLAGSGGLTVQTTSIDPFQVSAIIRAKQENQKVTFLTAPMVTAHDRERVNISVITQRAYISDYDLGSAGTGLTAVEVPDPVINTFQEGVVLDVRPTISYDRKYITLNIRPSIASLVGGVIKTILVDLGTTNMAAINVPIGTPQLSLQQAHTSVTVPDGGTALLGGFRRINESSYESTVPFLDKIPIINLLFKRRGYVKETSSLIILVTAKIVDIRNEERKRFNLK